MQQGNGFGVICVSCLGVDQNPRQGEFSCFTARFGCLFRQSFGLGVIQTDRIRNFDLRQERAGVGIAIVGGFLRPILGFAQIARTEPGIGKKVLCATVPCLSGL